MADGVGEWEQVRPPPPGEQPQHHHQGPPPPHAAQHPQHPQHYPQHHHQHGPPGVVGGPVPPHLHAGAPPTHHAPARGPPLPPFMPPGGPPMEPPVYPWPAYAYGLFGVDYDYSVYYAHFAGFHEFLKQSRKPVCTLCGLEDHNSAQCPGNPALGRGPTYRRDEHESAVAMIYISGLPLDVTAPELAEYFGSIGTIKMGRNKQTREKEPKVKIYTDKITGAIKGDATVVYEDAASASAAVEWFHGKVWRDRELRVELAEVPTRSSWGGRGGGRGGWGGGGRGGARGGGGGGGGRPGDWQCQRCRNRNFASRVNCNRCHEPRPGGGGGGGGGRRGYERRRSRSRSRSRGRHRDRRGF